MKCLMESVASEQFLRRLSLVLLLVGLSACSGGGGSSATSPAPAPSVALTSTNAEQVTAAALAQVLGDTSVGTISPLSNAETTTGVGRTTTLTSLARKALSLVDQNSSRVSAAVATTDPCVVSGSVTIDVAADGTSATITFNACEDVPGEIINGSMSMSNISVSGGTVNFNLTFSVSGQPDLVMSGGFSITATASTATITGTSFSGAQGTETFQLFNFTFVETLGAGFTTVSAAFTLNDTLIGGAVTVNTLVPFVIDDTAAYPHAGQMEISGANNSRIRVSVFGNELAPVDGQVHIEVDANGDAVFETTIMTTWAALGI